MTALLAMLATGFGISSSKTDDFTRFGHSIFKSYLLSQMNRISYLLSQYIYRISYISYLLSQYIQIVFAVTANRICCHSIFKYRICCHR